MMIISQSSPVFDLAIIGGGINGTGIAAEASQRGLKVFLCEQNDLASSTSSASSKLVHGGLRYLEQYEFRLVREALSEREVLLRKAPHLVWPLEFILPHSRQLRPAWMIRAGLFLYDYLSPRSIIPGSKTVNLQHNGITREAFKKGFSYYDCAVDDSRLVISNALAAQAHQAIIKTRTQCLKAEAKADGWQLLLQNQRNAEQYCVRARGLVNATGPWAESFFLSQLAPLAAPRSVRLVKGSHIIVPRLYAEKHAYILQNFDKRIIFVIPYLESFSLIGTTDIPYEGDPAAVHISESEIDYLLKCVNYYFRKPLNKADIVSHYSGVRPLCDDESNNPSAVTRDYTLILEEIKQQPLLSIFGGKITTYRRLAEAALTKLQPYFPALKPALDAAFPLPGGEFKPEEWPQLLAQLSQQIPDFVPKHIERLARSYGKNCFKVFAGVKHRDDLGQYFGAGLYQKEVEYLLHYEWAESAEDILWRRSKLGYFLTKEEQDTLTGFLHTS